MARFVGAKIEKLIYEKKNYEGLRKFIEQQTTSQTKKTMQQLADEIGCTRTHLTQISTGKSKPSDRLINIIAEKFGLTYYELVWEMSEREIEELKIIDEEAELIRIQKELENFL